MNIPRSYRPTKKGSSTTTTTTMIDLPRGAREDTRLPEKRPRLEDPSSSISSSSSLLPPSDHQESLMKQLKVAYDDCCHIRQRKNQPPLLAPLSSSSTVVHHHHGSSRRTVMAPRNMETVPTVASSSSATDVFVSDHEDLHLPPGTAATDESVDDLQDSWMDNLWDTLSAAGDDHNDDFTLADDDDDDDAAAAHAATAASGGGALDHHSRIQSLTFDPRFADFATTSSADSPLCYGSVREALESLNEKSGDSSNNNNNNNNSCRSSTTQRLEGPSDGVLSSQEPSSRVILPQSPTRSISMRRLSSLDDLDNPVIAPLPAARIMPLVRNGHWHLQHPLAAAAARPVPPKAATAASSSYTRRLQMPIELALVRNSPEPTVLTLTSFPFRVICVNQAFTNLTSGGGDDNGKSMSSVIGSPFFDLFVKESNHQPTISTIPTLLGVFNDDIVRVAAAVPGGATGGGPAMRPNHHHHQNPVFCRIKVHGIMKRTPSSVTKTMNAAYGNNHNNHHISGAGKGAGTGAELRYFSIKLSPLNIPATSLAAESVVYLPMPCSGVVHAPNSSSGSTSLDETMDGRTKHSAHYHHDHHHHHHHNNNNNHNHFR